MSRWLTSIIWTAGSCVIWCPFCVYLFTQGGLWVCASTVGLVSLTIISGYTTWTGLNLLLYGKDSKLQQYLSRYISLSSINDKNASIKSFEAVHSDLLEQEISSIAQTFHLHLILPWYSNISPEEKYALQIRTTVEDLLTGLFRNVQQNSDLMTMLQQLIMLYIQHYRQYYKALKKVSHKLKAEPFDCLAEKEEITASYKPLHSAYKTTNGINLHLQRLSHLLLVNYLPSEVSRCSVLFISLRDLFAQKLLHSTLDFLCDTQWLNTTLFSLLTDEPKKTASKIAIPNFLKMEIGNEILLTSPNIEINKCDEKVFSYTHNLSAIREETSLDLSDIDNEIKAAGGKLSANLMRRLSSSGSRSFSKELDDIPEYEKRATKSIKFKETNVDISIHKPQDSTSHKQTFENAEDLINYIRAPSFPPSNEEDSIPSVRSALGDFISTTAVPLLLDNSIAFPSLQPLPAKMWISPVDEKDFLTGVVHKRRKNPFKKNIIEGIKDEEYKRLFKMLSAKTEANERDLLNIPIVEEGFQLHRSKSLNNLVREVSFADTFDSSSKSTENLNNICNELEESKDRNYKRDKRLTKMQSFDRNDGTDAFSIHSNELTHPNVTKKELRELKILLESHLNVSCTTSEVKNSLSEVFLNKDADKVLGDSGIVVKSSSSSLDTSLSPCEETKGFCWENPDLSPIYEESQNLASTIAKLRCLLSERQSQHSLGSESSFGSSESEPKSAQSDPGKYNSLEKSRFTFLHKDSSGSLASLKSISSTDSCCQTMMDDEVLEASEVPLDGRVFIAISIPTTEVQSETAGFQYTVYIIRYDAIYLCDMIPPSSTVTEASSGDSTAVVQPLERKMVLQTNFVKRRFREFLTLHSSLEEDSHLRTFMKGVKGPNKWLNLPFSKLDSATISSRKLFLEKYLQAIIQRPNLNSSLPLKEFLGYGSDAPVSFVKKPSELNVPRLDKLLARTVSGVFHSIKTALPTFDSPEVQPNGMFATSLRNTFPLENITKSVNAKNLLSVNKNDFEIQLDMTAEEQNCEMEGAILQVIASTSELNSPVESALEVIESNYSVSFLPKSDPLMAPGFSPVNPMRFFYHANEAQSPFQDHSCNRRESPDDNNHDCERDKKEDLFKCLLDASMEILSSSGHPVTRQAATELIKRLCAHPASVVIQETINALTSERSIREIFERLRVCFTEALTADPKEVEEDSSLDNNRDYKKEIQEIITTYIPYFVKLLLGKEVTEKSVRLFVESFQQPIINQDFGLHLIDLLFVNVLLPIRMNG